ncbi:MAG: amidohydrolase [Clostridia bacterium]|nr:amidohydrolase [Clostridia bacterium]
MKIIDAHAHVVQYIAGFTSKGELRGTGGGRARYANGEEFQMIPPDMGEYGVTPEKLLEVMDANGVEKAVLLQGSFFGFQNEYTAQAVKKYPSRFVGAGTYDPFCNRAEEVKNYLFSVLGFKAVKFEVSNGSGLMAYHPPVDLDGEVMNGCYRHAADNGLTVVMDIGRPRNCCWQVDALASAIKKYPDTNFVICHLLAPQRTDNELLKQALGKLTRQNVYFDLAALAHNQQPEKFPYPTAVEHLKVAKAVAGADRLMFGSDMPGTLNRDSYAHLKDYIIDSNVFTSGELKDIFYNTAEKIYF